MGGLSQRHLCALAVAALAAACQTPGSVSCGDGRTCAPGFVCHPDVAICLLHEQIDACVDLDDGAECTFAGATGRCDSGACLVVPEVCGDGILAATEVCDDGNLVSGDGCAADCTSDETCGNGIVDLDEECDCGNDPNAPSGCQFANSDAPGATCRSNCLAHCGDGEVNLIEECEADVIDASCANVGFDFGRLECGAACSFVADRCGRLGFRVSTIFSSNAAPERDVWLTDAGDVWAVNENFFGHLRNGTWSVEPGAGGRDLWYASDEAVFVVTGNGLELFDGVSWTLLSPPGLTALRAVYGRSATDVYVVGDGGTLAHWNGVWNELLEPGELESEHPGDDLVSVWTGSDGTVFAGGNGFVLRYAPGGSWETDTLDSVLVSDIAGNGADDVYLAGWVSAAEGRAYRYDRENTQWQLVRTTQPLRSLWVGDDELFLGGTSGLIERFDGLEWAALSTGTSGTIQGMHGASDGRIAAIDDVSRVLLGQDAYLSSFTPSTTSLWSVWSDSPDIYAVGEAGRIWHHDGTDWTDESVASDRVLFDVGGANGAVFAVADTGEIFRRGDAGTWTAEPLVNDKTLWVIQGSDDYIVAAGRALFGLASGGDWESIATPGGKLVLDAWAAAPDELYAIVRPGTLYHYDGDEWTELMVGQRVQSVWGDAEDSVFVSADIGKVLHFDGDQWISQTVTNDVLGGVRGSSATDVIAISANGLYHFDGVAWSAIRGIAPPGWAAVDGSRIHVVNGSEVGSIIRRSPWD